jgi:cytochrome c5
VSRTVLVFASWAFLLPAVCAWSQDPVNQSKTLPEGTGKDIAEANCISCHDASPAIRATAGKTSSAG